MRQSEERFLATHAGSLPRLAALAVLHRRRFLGEKVSEAELEREADLAVRDVIARQLAAGIDIVNDGEQRRLSFARYLEGRLSGLGGSWDRPPRRDIEDFPLFKQMMRQTRDRAAIAAPDILPEAVGEVRHADPASPAHECEAFLAALAAAPGAPVEAFLTAPSPGFLATTMRNAHYDSDDAYLAALSEALRVEYEAIAVRGLLLQIDCPDFGVESGRLFYGRPKGEYIAFIDKVVEAINSAVRNIPRERIRLHVCWGNSASPRTHDIDLVDILPSVLKAKAGAIMLPFANGRHAHEYRVLERLPLAADQILIAGIIDTLTNVVEHPETVADRLVRIADVVGDPCRVIAGTDCGLETSVGGSAVAADVAWAKLAALAAGARLASRQVFS